jgi:hypothetical protein
METITIIFTSILVATLLFELAATYVYGWFISDDVALDYIEKFKPFEVNPFNDDIVSPGFDSTKPISEIKYRILNGKYIGKVPFPLISKYHISTIGRIPRWSRAHAEINELYKTA